jgi:uncharacterized protein (DUF362 family)
MHRIGNVIVEGSADKESFIEIVRSLGLRPPVVIKPNWGFSICFTEAEILDWTLTALDGDALVVESYGWARSEKMLRDGEWGSMEPEELRKSDEWFFDYSGIGDILRKHNVEFLNITEENWANRTADPNLVRAAIEERYPPLEIEDFYGFVPQRLYEMRGGGLLSLAKVRTLEPPYKVTFTMKNLFGMIPGPSRGKYHGEKNSKINQSIVDINKVYASLFRISGVVEAVFTASLRDPDTLEWENRPNLGFVSASNHPLELDAVMAALLGVDPHSVDYLKMAAETFGAWPEASVRQGQESGISII